MDSAAGWFAIPGVQEGPRTLAEQMLGLDAALAEADGKTVCDLGCAEGLIAMEFAKAGARSVYACDYNEQMIVTAKAEQAKLPPDPRRVDVAFYHADLRELIREERASGEIWQYDIVLALAILHKLNDPADGARFCCEIARSLIVVRLPAGSTGLIRGKHTGRPADVPAIFAACGFRRERKEEGPRGEWIQYWRRI